MVATGQADITAPVEKKAASATRTAWASEDDAKASPAVAVASPATSTTTAAATPKLTVTMNPADREPLFAISDDGLTVQVGHSL
jgi:hypothetical protein